jgi:hypothetical protein
LVDSLSVHTPGFDHERRAVDVHRQVTSPSRHAIAAANTTALPAFAFHG